MVAGGRLCGLAFADSESPARAAVLADMRGRFPGARFVEDAGAAQEMARWALSQPPVDTGSAVPLGLSGTLFEVAVWRALQAVPAGETRSYSDIAAAIGRPRAVRAVANAVGRNPLAWVVPCHRILRKNGELGGYHWGIARKRAMLEAEGVTFDVVGNVTRVAQLAARPSGASGEKEPGPAPDANRERLRLRGWQASQWQQ